MSALYNTEAKGQQGHSAGQGRIKGSHAREFTQSALWMADVVTRAG